MRLCPASLARVVSVLLLLIFATTAWGDKALDMAGPSTQPTAGAKRSVKAIMNDFRAASQPLQEFLSADTLADKSKREEAAPRAIPLLSQMQGCLNELRQTGDPHGRQLAVQIEPQLQVFLAVFGDPHASDRLAADARGGDKPASLAARSSLLMVRWIRASQDPAAQEQVLADARALADEAPEDDHVIGTVGAMAELTPANADLARKASQFVRMQEGKLQEIHHRKLLKLRDKPLTIDGVKADGSRFSTSEWKGKVIFVDFWATWCGPCKAELPRVKKAYADYHDKGLEVLGISCDNDAQELSDFLHANTDMPWPQLFDAAHPGWSPIATAYGIDSIPTMFLIDKKGVLRSVTAREDFEELIPRLLAE